MHMAKRNESEALLLHGFRRKASNHNLMGFDVGFHSQKHESRIRMLA
jgi:hypothetical protein